ncbi:MAG: amino acid dehydrogenase [Sphingopyxis sp.]|jgi:leucine dehydrogenase|nr:MAG: amino acid dehydrogenase [Sphingopyxis sp.]|tara:strand:- start:1026 stop:2096 length:1071 start_codon:yes stop_codon:yes gene_type:complete
MTTQKSSDPASYDLPKKIVNLNDIDSGLSGTIVIHSTRQGPATGGCRFWNYPDTQSLHQDAMRLAKGMSFKNAMAGLPLGGGKAVINIPQVNFDRAKIFRALGRAIQALNGEYVTAEDVGTDIADMTNVAQYTRFVAGLRASSGRPGGDPSPFTARGVFECMRVAVEGRLDRPLSDVTVAVQGAGNVGFQLCAMLHEEGAKLIVAEHNSAKAAAVAARFGAEVASCNSIIEAKADVFAPCALGGVLSSRSVAKLQAKVVCGAANNQLAVPEVAEQLADHGVLYAPDYVVNAGGIINVAGEYLGWTIRNVEDRVNAIAPRLKNLFAVADQNGSTVQAAADNRAQALMMATALDSRAA